MSATSLVMNTKGKGKKVPSLPLQERSPARPVGAPPQRIERKEERRRKPPRPKIIPNSRDRIAQFSSRRNEVKETKDRFYAIIVKRLAQLSMEYLTKPSNQGMFSFLWGGDNTVHIPAVGVELKLPSLHEDARACTSCGTPFGYFQKRVVCQLCMKPNCAKCAFPRVPLQVIKEAPVGAITNGSKLEVPMIDSCESCSRMVKNWKYSQKFQRSRLSAGTNPIVGKYDGLLKMDENVVEALIKYEACVNEADPPKQTKRAPGEPENILAMRLGEASHLATQVERHVQGMAAALQDILNLKNQSPPLSEATRKLVHTIHTTASARLEEHIAYYQSLQKRLLRLQLVVVGDVYNKFHQLIIEVNQLHQWSEEEKTGEKNGESGPNIYLLLREVLTVIKAEIQELMITMGKQQWPKFEKQLDATLKEQMAQGQKLLNVPFSRDSEMRKLLMTKIVSVIQHEAQALENNTAIATLRESKRIIKSVTGTILSHYF